MKYLIYLFSRIFCNYSDLKQNIEEALKDNDITNLSFDYRWKCFFVIFTNTAEEQSNTVVTITIRFDYFNPCMQFVSFCSSDISKIETVRSNIISAMQKQVQDDYILFIVDSYFSNNHIISVNGEHIFAITRKCVYHTIKTSKKLKIEDL